MKQNIGDAKIRVTQTFYSVQITSAAVTLCEVNAITLQRISRCYLSASYPP
jgi:hypothetical protein